MSLPTRAVRTGAAVLAITAGLVTFAGPAVAQTSPSPAGTGSAEWAQSVFAAIGCAVGANSCGSIVIPT